MARPKKGQEKWNETLPQKLIEHMSKGYSFEAFGAVANCNRICLYQWIDKHSEFAEAKSIGDIKSRYFWETLGVNGMVGKIPNFAQSVWIFTMKCRFGYRDGSETGEQTDTKKDKVYKARWGSAK